jgi:hypothetical protein
MKLLTKAIEAKFERSNAGADTQGRRNGDILVKYFDPCGRYTLYVLEAEKVGDDWQLYGYCVSPLGEDCDEYGYASLNELQSVRGRFGLGIERDLHFKGTIGDVVAVAAGVDYSERVDYTVG